LPPDLCQNLAYAIDSPLWKRWFKADHEARQLSIEAHLDGSNNDDHDYEDEEGYQVPQWNLSALKEVKREEAKREEPNWSVYPPTRDEEWAGYVFPTLRPGQPN
jgi:hypothetical protein